MFQVVVEVCTGAVVVFAMVVIPLSSLSPGESSIDIISIDIDISDIEYNHEDSHFYGKT
jgi:hypothetical protein